MPEPSEVPLSAWQVDFTSKTNISFSCSRSLYVPVVSTLAYERLSCLVLTFMPLLWLASRCDGLTCSSKPRWPSRPPWTNDAAPLANCQMQQTHPFKLLASANHNTLQQRTSWCPRELRTPTVGNKCWLPCKTHYSVSCEFDSKGVRTGLIWHDLSRWHKLLPWAIKSLLPANICKHHDLGQISSR